ncbi:MAG: hypothetical protein JO334_12630 [Verrucomicrobia bacterium]|nr:hypothetical protein [Verrucomicrobiota bacterium]
MSNHLNLLMQNYCRPVTLAGKITHDLFPLEKGCGEGKTLLAKAPAVLLQVQEFDPCGLAQSYRDEVTGAELPVFAVFNLEGKQQSTFEITADLLPTSSDRSGLEAKLPFEKGQSFVKKMNERRMRVERAITIIIGMLGTLPVLAYGLSRLMGAGGTEPFVFLGAWLLGAMLVYMIGVNLLDRLCPWRKLVITAEFNGILPREAREKARTARDHFDKLYLVVDQQGRWKSDVLPDPAPRALDPLLVGEVKQGGTSRFFVIHQFDLTQAEQYLADEFSVKPD